MRVITVKTRVSHLIVLLLTTPISLCTIIIMVNVHIIITIGYFFPFVLDLPPSRIASVFCYDGLISQRERTGSYQKAL